MAVSSLAVSYIKEAAKDTVIDSVHAFSRIVEGAINRIRREILESMQDRSYSVAEQEEMFGLYSKHYFQLMFAHYFFPKPDVPKNQKQIPCLYTISLNSILSEPQFPFAVLGAAPELAMFELKQFECEKLNGGEAMCLAIETLERINNDDITCGGPIKIGFLRPIYIGTIGLIYQDEFSSFVLKKLEPIRKRNNARQKKQFSAVTAKVNKQIEKEMRQMFGLPPKVDADKENLKSKAESKSLSHHIDT